MGNCFGGSRDEAGDREKRLQGRLSRQAKLGAIFRYFDEDKDGVWSYEEVARWSEVVKDRRMTVQHYESLCRTLRTDLRGLQEVHVSQAYGVDAKGSRTIDSHFQRLVDSGADVRVPTDDLFLIPGMTVELKNLFASHHLAGTTAQVLSVVPEQDAAIVATAGGPVLVRSSHLAHPSPATLQRRPKRALVISQTAQSPDEAKDILHDAMVERGWTGDATEWRFVTGAGLTKSQVMAALSWATRNAQRHSVFVALLRDPAEVWDLADSARVGPLRPNEVYEKLVLMCPPGAEVVLLETGMHRTALLPLPLAVSRDVERWETVLTNSNLQAPHEAVPEAAALFQGRDGARDIIAEGMVPSAYWVTSGDQPQLAGRYVKSDVVANDWPTWACGGKTMYSDKKGVWKICTSADEMAAGVGYLKGQGRHALSAMKSSGGQDLPGFEAVWMSSLHGEWARSPDTHVSATAPRVVSVAACGASVVATAKMFAAACRDASTLADLVRHCRRFVKAVSVTSMHGPELTGFVDFSAAADGPATPPTPCARRSASRVCSPDPLEEDAVSTPVAGSVPAPSPGSATRWKSTCGGDPLALLDSPSPQSAGGVKMLPPASPVFTTSASYAPDESPLLSLAASASPHPSPPHPRDGLRIFTPPTQAPPSPRPCDEDTGTPAAASPSQVGTEPGGPGGSVLSSYVQQPPPHAKPILRRGVPATASFTTTATATTTADSAGNGGDWRAARPPPLTKQRSGHHFRSSPPRRHSTATTSSHHSAGLGETSHSYYINTAQEAAPLDASRAADSGQLHAVDMRRTAVSSIMQKNDALSDEVYRALSTRIADASKLVQENDMLEEVVLSFGLVPAA